MKEQEFEEAWDRALDGLGDVEVSSDGAALKLVFDQLRSGGFSEDQALRIISYGIFHQPNTGDDVSE